MPTLVLDPQPRELRELLKHRKRSGLHRLDEVWEGVLHMVSAPSGPHAYIAQQLAMLLGTPARAAGLVPVLGAFNLGGSEADFRVPDGGLHRAVPRATWYPTAAVKEMAVRTELARRSRMLGISTLQVTMRRSKTVAASAPASSSSSSTRWRYASITTLLRGRPR